ncbi:exported hypothetical protein [Mesorhizobium sp. STM 4661]|nr:exported hypothetical protein [Mesorhizobium sp. STM 4661]
MMSLAGLPLKAMASPIASAVACQRPAMSRSTQRACGIDCGTRRRATANCEPSASKITAFVTVRPLSIPSRLDMTPSGSALADMRRELVLGRARAKDVHVEPSACRWTSWKPSLVGQPPGDRNTTPAIPPQEQDPDALRFDAGGEGCRFIPVDGVDSLFVAMPL